MSAIVFLEERQEEPNERMRFSLKVKQRSLDSNTNSENSICTLTSDFEKPNLSLQCTIA